MAARISKADFDAKVLASELPVIVDFYSDSCVACKKLAPVLGGAEEDFEDKLTVLKLNTTFDPEVAEKYEVKSTPTLILFKNGELVDRKIGFVKPSDLQTWIESNI